LLYAGYAAAYPWSKIGTEVQFARAELPFGRAGIMGMTPAMLHRGTRLRPAG